MKPIKNLLISGQEVLPFVEGGKGIAVSSGLSAGAWAKAGGVGTFSGVNADFYDEQGNCIPAQYHGTTRQQRHEELIAFGIRGGIAQARIAQDISKGNGRIHMNILWEMGGAERILKGILEGASGLIHGVTCGAGMPYKLAEISAHYGVYAYPIVSSARAFRALWKRSFHKYPHSLGGVCYEDPWLAGGHNGLSNSENPNTPQPPYERVLELRKIMQEFGLEHTPIIMAGGVWHLSEWQDWIDSSELGPIAFQFGTRPLLTQESPISDEWKGKLLSIKAGDVHLNRFSPTGFYSSAVSNAFLSDLEDRSATQMAFSTQADAIYAYPLAFGRASREIYVSQEDGVRAQSYITQGRTHLLKTPDQQIVFVFPEESESILRDQVNCMGCLSACAFSNWSQDASGTTGKKPDPRSFCIQKTLKSISHDGDIDRELMFAGHNAYRFSEDPFYKDGFIPTVQELIERIQTGY